jgi:hypothetical protein
MIIPQWGRRRKLNISFSKGFSCVCGIFFIPCVPASDVFVCGQVVCRRESNTTSGRRNEHYVSAAQSQEEEHARFPRSHGDKDGA